MKEVSAAQVVGVGFDIARRRLSDNLLFLRQEFDFQLLDNRVCDLVLNDEDVGQVAIKARGPEVSPVLAVDQLSCNTHAGAGFSHTSFQDKSHTKLLSDLLHFYRFAFVSERGIASDNEEPGDIGQVGNYVLGNPIAEVFLFRVATHIVDGE